jgi:hypothetical protein
MRQILKTAKFLVATDDSDMMQAGKDRVAAQYAAVAGLDMPYTGLVRHARMMLRSFPSYK